MLWDSGYRNRPLDSLAAYPFPQFLDRIQSIYAIKISGADLKYEYHAIEKRDKLS